jgi:hypothetical protein
MIAASDKRREVETDVLCWAPCQCEADRKPLNCALRVDCFTAAAVLHFKSHLKLLFWQMNWDLDALRKASARAFSAARLLINENVHRPLDLVRKVVRDQKCGLARIMRCIGQTETVFSSNRGIEREFVPIGQGVTRFEGKGAIASVSREMFDLVLHANRKARWQSHFDLLTEKLSG